MHRSSPVGYLRNACSPRNRGEMGPFSNGYRIVYGSLKKFSNTIHIPSNHKPRNHKPQFGNRARSARSMAGRTSDNLRKEEQMNSLVDRTGTVSVRVHILVRFCFRTNHANTKVRRANLPTRNTMIIMRVLSETTGSRRYGVSEYDGRWSCNYSACGDPREAQRPRKGQRCHGGSQFALGGRSVNMLT